MKRKAHKLRKAANHTPNTGKVDPERWRRCQDVRCPLPHPNDASPENPGPPGVQEPRMNRTRPVRT